MTERNRSTEKNTMLGFCKGNKMMSSVIWCEKIKVKISKTTKLHEPYLQSRKKKLTTSYLYQITREIQLSLVINLHHRRP